MPREPAALAQQLKAAANRDYFHLLSASQRGDCWFSIDQTTSFASVADDARVRTDTAGRAASPPSRAMDSENLEIDTGRFAISCPIADCATTEQPYASAIEGSTPDPAAARIYGCREVDLVAIREPVDEPSRGTGAGAAELPPRR